MGNRALTWLGILILFAAFVAVFVSVLNMRISRGDIYPHYATFRTDPLGASAMYEAFGRLPEYSVEQNVQSLMQIEGLDENTVLLLLGVPRRQFGRLRVPDSSPVLQAVKEKGTRLVITVDPQTVPLRFRNTLFEDPDNWIDQREEAKEEEKKKLQGKDPGKTGDGDAKQSGDQPDKQGDASETGDPEIEEEDDEAKTLREKLEQERKKRDAERDEQLGKLLVDLFKIDIADLDRFDRPDEGWEVSGGKGIDMLLPLWKSQYRFELPEKSPWKVIAKVEKEPVVVERKLGKGSLVFATDSYFAGNEALYGGGDSEFLLWLVGDKKRLVFDETMHGSQEKTGVVKILRQYRLHGFLIGLLVFVGLWAWRSSSSLAPGDEALDRGLVAGGSVAGSDANSGLIRLLQRSIPTSSLLNHCFSIWQNSRVTGVEAKQMKQIGEIRKRHESNPREMNSVEAYKQIARVLKKR